MENYLENIIKFCFRFSSSSKEKIAFYQSSIILTILAHTRTPRFLAKAGRKIVSIFTK